MRIKSYINMTIVQLNSSNNIFDIKLTNCKIETQAYIKSIFHEFLQVNNKDLSKESITIKYLNAKLNYDFEQFRDIGDWIFWASTMYPESLNSANPDFYNTIAQSSYYRCYLILDKQWDLYEEMSDQFEHLVEILKTQLLRQNVPFLGLIK